MVYETPDFLVVYKPSGVLVHSVKGGERAEGRSGVLTDWLLENYPEVGVVGDDPNGRPGIVHRLDKETSGVLLVARNQDAFLDLKSMFQRGEVKKQYKTLVWGELKGRGVIDKPIGLISGSVRRSVSGRNMKMIKPALTEYKSLGVYDFNGEKFSLLDVFIKTGRTHQIRVHLNSIHHPVLGDQLYGKKKDPWGLSRQFLHAESLEFLWGKDGHKVRVEADMPGDLEGILKSLEK